MLVPEGSTMHRPVFHERRSAGTLLGIEVAKVELERPVVLGLPRGGVPVAAEVAVELHAPLDVIVVRKLGVPHQPELAMGAIGENGIVIVNEDVLRATRVSDEEFEEIERRERRELDRSLSTIRVARPRQPLVGCDAVIVDDGIATGATIRAAIQVARASEARQIVVATPVAPHDVVAVLESIADRVVCLAQPDAFGSVGRWFRNFDAVSLDEVLELLADAIDRDPP
jgi:putative phosphoribosyl transferase